MRGDSIHLAIYGYSTTGKSHHFGANGVLERSINNLPLLATALDIEYTRPGSALSDLKVAVRLGNCNDCGEMTISVNIKLLDIRYALGKIKLTWYDYPGHDHVAAYYIIHNTLELPENVRNNVLQYILDKYRIIYRRIDEINNINDVISIVRELTDIYKHLAEVWRHQILNIIRNTIRNIININNVAINITDEDLEDLFDILIKSIDNISNEISDALKRRNLYVRVSRLLNALMFGALYKFYQEIVESSGDEDELIRNLGLLSNIYKNIYNISIKEDFMSTVTISLQENVQGGEIQRNNNEIIVSKRYYPMIVGGRLPVSSVFTAFLLLGGALASDAIVFVNPIHGFEYLRRLARKHIDFDTSTTAGDMWNILDTIIKILERIISKYSRCIKENYNNIDLEGLKLKCKVSAWISAILESDITFENINNNIIKNALEKIRSLDEKIRKIGMQSLINISQYIFIGNIIGDHGNQELPSSPYILLGDTAIRDLRNAQKLISKLTNEKSANEANVSIDEFFEKIMLLTGGEVRGLQEVSPHLVNQIRQLGGVIREIATSSIGHFVPLAVTAHSGLNANILQAAANNRRLFDIIILASFYDLLPENIGKSRLEELYELINSNNIMTKNGLIHPFRAPSPDPLIRRMGRNVSIKIVPGGPSLERGEGGINVQLVLAILEIIAKKLLGTKYNLINRIQSYK